MSARIELPNPAVERDWAEQMSLEKAGASRFRSLKGAPFGPPFMKNGEMRARAFGGHVYAQAAYAASKTVADGFFVHSVTGYFITIGLADEPFIYDVQVVRDGKSYCVRKVDVWQGGDQVCFSSICSFKKVEPNFLDAQIPRDFDTEYHDLLKGVKPEDLPLNTDINARNFRAAYAKKENYVVKSFPGMITSVLNMEEFHKDQHPLLRRNLYIYSTLDEKKTIPVDANLEACAHMYHSDRESVWGMVKNFDLLEVLEFAASLSHTIVFHAGPERLGFRGTNGARRWFYLETGADRLADGRGLHQGKIFDESGYHVASTLQDGAIRLSSNSSDMAERQRKLQINGKL